MQAEFRRHGVQEDGNRFSEQLNRRKYDNHREEERAHRISILGARLKWIQYEKEDRPKKYYNLSQKCATQSTRLKYICNQ